MNFKKIWANFDISMIIIKDNLCHYNSSLSVFLENTDHPQSGKIVIVFKMPQITENTYNHIFHLSQVVLHDKVSMGIRSRIVLECTAHLAHIYSTSEIIPYTACGLPQ